MSAFIVGGILFAGGLWWGYRWGYRRADYITRHAMLDDIHECLGVEAGTQLVSYSLSKRGTR